MQAMCFYCRVIRKHFTAVKRRKAVGYGDGGHRAHSGGQGVRWTRISIQSTSNLILRRVRVTIVAVRT